VTSTGCVTPGPLYVVTAAGNQVQLPLSDPEAECNYVFTYRDTIGIVRVLAHPTPDAPRTYSYTYDEQGGPCSTTCYENQWSELSLRWDPPPTPQNPRCPPTGNGILDNEAFRDSLWAAMEKSNFSGPNHTRMERGGEVLVNKTTGDTVVRFTMNIDSLSGPCQRGFSFTAQSGYDLIAIFHTHPFAPGTRTAPDASCGWKVGEEVPSMARGYSPGIGSRTSRMTTSGSRREIPPRRCRSSSTRTRFSGSDSGPLKPRRRRSPRSSSGHPSPAASSGHRNELDSRRGECAWPPLLTDHHPRRRCCIGRRRW
jgi:hypothetical protein